MTKPSDTNTETPHRWANDCLGRQHDSQFLMSFLTERIAERKASGRERSYVLNIDAAWGHGKTYFLERFKEDLAERYTVAYVNAWEDDHAEDPLIALMIAIEQSLVSKKAEKAAEIFSSIKRASGKLAITLGKHAAIGLAQCFIGQEGIKALNDALADDDAKKIEEASESVVTELVGSCAEAALKEFEITKETIADFKAKLREFVGSEGVKRPIFILIDELDRCRPSYAVALLERIKHLFDIEDLVFVVATDTNQLQHAVTAVYGVRFDGAGYLLRFFDRTYRFATPDPRDFIAAHFTLFNIDSNLLSSPMRNEHVAYFSGVASAFKLSLREIERCIDVLRSVLTVWPYKQRRARVELAYLLPLIVAHCRGGGLLFETLSKFNPSELERQWNGSDVVFPLPYPRRDSPTNFGISEPTRQLLDRASSKLDDIVNVQQTPAGVRGWVRERYLDELSTIHSGRAMQSWDGRSILKTYPELVRSVGRLSGQE